MFRLACGGIWVGKVKVEVIQPSTRQLPTSLIQVTGSMGEQSQTSTTGEGTGGERLAIAFLGPEGTYGQQVGRPLHVHCVSYSPVSRQPGSSPGLYSCKGPSIGSPVPPSPVSLSTRLCDRKWRTTEPALADAFEYRARYTVLPLENTIFGPVTETFDCLFRRLNTSRSCASGSDSFPRTTSKGKEKEIVGTLDLPIRHCLVVKRGTQMSDIRWVKSHEQVSIP